ncbi:MAG: hypothetical protein JRI25_17460 [Deltaproteobacteria bacterium]|nr:hypothetical protein [Deltaproteobacteria bacterium]
MEFFESIEEVEEQIELTRGKLELLEEDVTRRQAMARIRAAHPWHPVLVARMLFVVLTLMAVLAALGVAALPFIDPKLSKDLIPLQNAIGLPLPIVLGMLAVVIGVAWMMATQASVIIGRECPLLPWEKKERERLSGELSRLTRQRQMMARVRGTPMGARPRLMTPVPGARRTRTTTGAGVDRSGVPGGGEPLPSYAAPTGGGPITVASRTTRGGTPLGAPPRMGTPIGASMRSTSSVPAQERSEVPEPLIDDVVGVEEDTDQFHDRPYGAPEESVGQLIEDTEQNYDDGFALSPDSEPTDAGVGTPLAGWEDIQEEWLIDALEKAEILAENFPVQARLELNQAAGLPFTLILERATPAMAVRAMMAYVEFLASIAVPPKGRVELVSIPHLDRSFHRNIKAALEPYFPGTADVDKKDDYVDIIFREPDLRWAKYPFIPIPE